MDAVRSSAIRGSFRALFCWSGELTCDILFFVITTFAEVQKLDIMPVFIDY